MQKTSFYTIKKLLVMANVLATLAKSMANNHVVVVNYYLLRLCVINHEELTILNLIIVLVMS